MLSILWLFVYDYKTVCDHAWIPILFFFFFFERLNSRFRTWITAEWPDTWPMWVTLMDWSLRDSWSRNYRISLRFSNHFCWNWIEIVHIFCGIWIDCLSTLFFFFLGGGEVRGSTMVLFELGKMMVNDCGSHWILHGTKKKNCIEHFCIKESSSIFFSFFVLFFFNSEWIAISISLD